VGHFNLLGDRDHEHLAAKWYSILVAITQFVPLVKAAFTPIAHVNHAIGILALPDKLAIVS
jgi:hypothetical protein